jgi:hypothetical protein
MLGSIVVVLAVLAVIFPGSEAATCPQYDKVSPFIGSGGLAYGRSLCLFAVYPS